MKRWMTLIAGLMVALAGVTLAARQTPPDEQLRALRSRVEARFDVVPITGGIALTPKTRIGEVRMIEVSDRGIAINGTVERLDSVATAVVRSALRWHRRDPAP